MLGANAPPKASPRSKGLENPAGATNLKLFYKFRHMTSASRDIPRISGVPEYYTSSIGILVDTSVIYNMACGMYRDPPSLYTYLQDFNSFILVTQTIINECIGLSYKNPSHEETIREFIRKAYPVHPDPKPYQKKVRKIYNEAKKRFRHRTREMSRWHSKEAAERATAEMKTDPAYTSLHHKLIEEPPTDSDLKMLAEAAALKKNYQKLLLVSDDHHFISIYNGRDTVLTNLIPNLINERLGILCVRQEQAASLLYEREMR